MKGRHGQVLGYGGGLGPARTISIGGYVMAHAIHGYFSLRACSPRPASRAFPVAPLLNGCRLTCRQEHGGRNREDPGRVRHRLQRAACSASGKVQCSDGKVSRKSNVTCATAASWSIVFYSGATAGPNCGGGTREASWTPLPSGVTCTIPTGAVIFDTEDVIKYALDTKPADAAALCRQKRRVRRRPVLPRQL